VTINCGAIPENLLESELFGHVKGSFTGAVANKPGKFHAPTAAPSSRRDRRDAAESSSEDLARAAGKSRGAAWARRGPSRSISASSPPPTAFSKPKIKHSRFREDLYYRLNVVNIHLPPLRDRGDDVLVIAKYLLNRFTGEFGGMVKGFHQMQ